MIINIPSSEDYKKIAIECWIQAFDTLYEAMRYISIFEYEDIVEETLEFLQPNFRTAIVLLHQGIESILKSEICKSSALLLLDNKRTDWPVLPNQSNKDFNEMFTIGAESLLNTYCAVINNDIDSSIVIFIEKIRKLRNKIVHGFGTELLNPNDTVLDILESFTYFIGSGSWWKEMKKFHFQHPLYYHYDPSHIKANFADRLDFVYEIMSKKDFIKHTNFNIKQRLYKCPNCAEIYEFEFEEYPYTWAILTPNTPNSMDIFCLNCEDKSEVIRINCKKDTCKGNVLYEMDNHSNDIICLTCSEIQ